MKSGHLGLLLSLMSSVALAQNAPAGTPATPPIPSAATQGAGAQGAGAQGSGSQGPMTQSTGGAAIDAQGAANAPNGADQAQGLAAAPGTTGQGGNDQAQSGAGDANAAPGQSDQFEGEIIQTPNGTFMVRQPQGDEQGMQSAGQGDDMQASSMGGGAMGGGAMGGPRPHPRMAPPSKAAHFRIKGPDLALDIKCPDEEPVRACVDAASMLIDKANSGHH